MGAIQRFHISTEHTNDNHKRKLTLFLEIFTFQELNSMFHKHSNVFSFAVCKTCKTVILFSLNVVVEVKFVPAPSNIRCSSKVLTVPPG